ncbi:SMI1/KNR4 family protein [Parendozoicomonas haliclonae]|uniref:SMI1 / KNR4 family protein n=1 Tax=Parendozoicomonas haliclonae TaxID=1960125 RepID=A0A1X7AQX1_9GAMM|nr:SMI1/KNR4 family protein [Parendozoicomonas haliclonae]SMA50635.1 SMI1 / KNR4 family protein [Parendozoicomonas haliclonae]
MNIEYVPHSFAHQFSEREMASIERMLKLDLPNFEFDPIYLSHIKSHHGGKPVQKFFHTSSGLCLPIERFLNFSDTSSAPHDDKIFNISVVWSLIEDRLNEYLVPFAALPNGDFLCFDYEHENPPQIVLWINELSAEDQPQIEPVSQDFKTFLHSLSPTIEP